LYSQKADIRDWQVRVMRARSLSDREGRLCGDGLWQVCKYADTFMCKGGGRSPGLLRVQLWNIANAYPSESEAYLYETRR